VIGRGSRATVYEATQLSLDRRVAFKLFDDRTLSDRVRRLASPDHPAAVGLFSSGDSEHGPWLAMRLVPGGATLATRRARLDQVAAALDRAHEEGIVHGNLTARNVLVAGDRAFVSDFGLGPEDATAEDDRAALAALVREHPPPAQRGRVVAIALVAGVAATVALFAVLANRGDDDDGAGAAAPPVPAGARALGSDLAPGSVESVDCNGDPPSGASPACTVSQLRLASRPVVVPASGTITSWAVRGARGSLSLQVLRGDDRRLIQIERSPDEAVPGPGVHVAKADLAVTAGDRVALQVAPGAAVGVRRAPRAAIQRWFGPLNEPPRPPERPAGTGFDDELLLRVDVSPRRDGEMVDRLQGAAAARAPRGRRLASVDVQVGGGETRTVTIVALGRAVALDLFDGSRRLARAPLPRADGRGTLAEFFDGEGYVRVRWRNPGGDQRDRTVEVAADELS
jgi:hypothetical protein